MQDKISLRALRPAHWGWLNFKLVIGLAWPVLVLLAMPPAPAEVLGHVFGLAGLVTVIGTVISVIGLLMTAQPDSSVRTIGLSIELVGISFVAALPLTYAIAQVVLFVSGDPDGLSRIAIAILAWASVSALAARALTLIPAWRQEAVDPTKKV